MKKLTSKITTLIGIRYPYYLVLFTLSAVLLPGCGLGFLTSQDGLDEVELAEIELSVQQTLVAGQATQLVQEQQKMMTEVAFQATQTAAAEQFKQTEVAFQATQAAQAAGLTAAQDSAQQSQAVTDTAKADAVQEQPSQETGDSTGASSEIAASGESTAGDAPTGGTSAEFSQEAFEAWMKDAKILLYEDAVNYPPVKRYVKDALDDMGLDYKDDGSAKGWLKSDLLSGTWDLVIIALEAPTIPPTGEYFDLINQTLDKGSAVILEIWFLNYIDRGEVASTLNRCGVELESDYGVTTYTYNDLINWPLPGKSDHPVLTEPNSGIRWTNIAAIRGPDDLGDFIKLSGKKDDAELLLGAIATEKNTHGTMAVCSNGKFIIQTFHTHNLAYEEALPLWQNYIYNTLKARYLETQ